MAIRPILSNGQTTADLAEKAGLSQAEIMAQNQNQNPDTMVGGAAMAKTPIPTAPPVPTTPAKFELTNASGGKMNFGSKEERDAYYGANKEYWNDPNDTDTRDQYLKANFNPDGTPKTPNRPVLDGSTPSMDGLVKPRSQEEIRQEQMKQAQAMIDATEALFQEQLSGVRQKGQQALAQTSAIGTSAGIAGSPFGQAQQQQQIDASGKQEKLVQQERSAEIQRINAAAQNRATDIYDKEIARFQTERAFSVGERDKEIATLAAKTAAAKTAIKEAVQNAAKGGYSLSEIDPALLKESGMTDFEVNAAYTAANPALNGKTEVSNGYVVNYYIDPKTGKPVITKEALPKELSGVDEANLSHVTLADGEYVYDTKHLNADGTPKLMKLGGKEIKPNFDQAKFTADLRKEFNSNKAVQDFQVVDSAYRKMEAVGGEIDSGPARDAMVIVFNKMLDPGSVVREGEFARSADGQAVITKAGEWVKALTTPGAGINAATLQQMKDAAKKIHEASKIAYDAETAFYTQNAIDAGVEPKNVIRGATSPQTPATNIDKNDPDFSALRSDPDLNGMSDEDIWSSLGKTSVGSVTENAQTGALSERYESGGDAGAIGYDSTGGYSYGKYQLAHQNAKRFVEQSPYAKDFAGLEFNSKAWQDKWKSVAQADPQGFGGAQKQYIEQSHITPQINKLNKIGYNTAGFSPVLKDVIWSTAVQHGANTDVVEKALAKVGKNASEKDIINAIYDERWSGGRRFASSTPAVQRAVKNRFFGKDGERDRALSMIG